MQQDIVSWALARVFLGAFGQAIVKDWPILLCVAVVLGSARAAVVYQERRLARSGVATIDQMDGRTFEHRLALLFTRLGYQVEETPYSGDYGADLVISKDGKQAVVGSSPISRSLCRRPTLVEHPTLESSIPAASIGARLEPGQARASMQERDLVRTRAPGQAQGPAPTGVMARLSLPEVVQRFKSLTTARYLQSVTQFDWPSFPGRLWQRNYCEHIVRNDDDLDRIRDYIANNPGRWAEDEEANEW